MIINRTNKNQIQISCLSLNDYRIIKMHLSILSEQPIIIDNEDSIYRLVLIELYKEKGFDRKGDPITNDKGYVTMTLKPSQAKALSIIPCTIKNLGEYQPYIDSFFPFFSDKIGHNILQLPNVSRLDNKVYDSGRLAAGKEHLRLENNE